MNISTKFKAAFLLLVFSFNTIIGFACSLDIDMGFNTRLHSGKSLNENDSYKASRIGITKTKKKHKHPYLGKSHCHLKRDGSTGGCCNESVLEYQNLVKETVQNTEYSNTLFFVALISNFLGVSIFKSVGIDAQPYKRPYFHPPAPDIRVLIQSFQI